MQVPELAVSPVLAHAGRVLVINFKYLGDSIWMLPFLDNLRKYNPTCHISVLVNEGTETFFLGHSSVDTVMTFPRKAVKRFPSGMLTTALLIRQLRMLKPDVILELTDTDRPAVLSWFAGAPVRVGYNNQNRWRNRLYTRTVRAKIYEKHMVEYHLDMLRELGVPVADTTLRIPEDRQAAAVLRSRFPSVFQHDGRPRILVHPGARGPLRQWGAARFATVANALAGESRVFFVAGSGEQKLLDEILAKIDFEPELCTSDLSIREFGELCGQSELFLGNDSGPIHIAAAKTFVIGIYGPTLPEFVSPWTEKKLLLDPGPVSCRPCRQDGCINEKYKECINRIHAGQVIAAVRDALRRSGH
ncbi:MAG TPA: glycosyltransferase family 9 protein [Dissulfurispiraceae bacterium]|nr:glycosyltransferase family 9 protein [Dissulfurispiraceae bacterium]